MANTDDAAPTLPAASVALAVMECAPSASVTSRLNAPVALAAVVPSEAAPSNNSTRALASAWPVMVSADVWSVTLSALSVPLSSTAARSTTVGASGGVVSLRAATKPPTTPRPASPRPIMVPERPVALSAPCVLPALAGEVSGRVETSAPPPPDEAASVSVCSDDAALSTASSTFTVFFLPFSVNDKTKSLPIILDFMPETNAPVAASTITTFAPTKGGSSLTRAFKATFLIVPFSAVIWINFGM